MSVSLKVNLLGKEMAGPVVGASGTFGFGKEYAGMVDLKKLGGISGKGITLIPKAGNQGERLLETPSGLINSIGLQNPGVQHFIDHELPVMETLGTTIWANLGGGCIEDYEKGAELLNPTSVDFVELNISCPNVKQGGIAYGIKAESAKEVVSRVRAVCKKPLIVKLSPQAEDICQMAAACVEAGADALSLVNTFQACAIDLEKRRPVFNNIFAGLSGPAIKPIALRMVYQVCGAVNVPVIGLGGILTGADALEFIMAGATAVQVGTANFMNPRACETITDEIAAWMEAHGVETLDEIRGCARV
ncbi:dihydroorotate dehydrogenase [Allofournierella massiliensis]|uniref:Dihydroorotate dehydrogenase n=1 Tax=Allofournierella massiliensis TaxID=1650663 RepID=A0ABT7UTD6_9FIRM|nr:dihydroorotate dehydrogenase [Fournierella massiliensis]MDM8202149.1 dihydroorotate dehydrogenase [Fournierella massiliensis]